MREENVNIAIRFSEDAPNENLHDLTDDFRRRSNSSFFAEVRTRLDTLAKKRGKAGRVHLGVGAIGLIGEYGPVGMALRRAQRLIRLDKEPSRWSHSFLFVDPIAADAKGNRLVNDSPRLLECTIDPSERYRQIAHLIGISARRLADYNNATFDIDKPHSVPNVCVIVFEMSAADRDAIVHRAVQPSIDQLRYPLDDSLASWYAHVRHPARHPNPLARGESMFCSAYLQLAYEAAGIDLGLGAQQANLMPEHIWQTAKYFHRPYEEQKNAIHAYWCIRDPYGGIPPRGTKVPKDLADLAPKALQRKGRATKKRSGT